MKRIEERNLPFPVLLENGGDFNDAIYQVECEINMVDNNKNIELIFDYKLKCPFIEKLIENGKIMPVVHIEQRTFRKISKLDHKWRVTIPLNWLSPNYNIDIMPMLVAKEDYRFSYDESMDRVFSYFDDDFEVKRYQIVGYGNYISCSLPTNTKIGSIFTFSRLKEESIIKKGNPYILTFDKDTIDIQVLPNLYDSVISAINNFNTFNKLIYSSFVYSAVQMAIYHIVQDYESVKDLKWCISICNKLSKDKKVYLDTKNNISSQEIIEYSHYILETLLIDAFNDIENGGE